MFGRRKPWKVEVRWHYFFSSEEWSTWSTWQRYRTRERRDQALRDLRHRYDDKDYIEFREADDVRAE